MQEQVFSTPKQNKQSSKDHELYDNIADQTTEADYHSTLDFKLKQLKAAYNEERTQNVSPMTGRVT